LLEAYHVYRPCRERGQSAKVASLVGPDSVPGPLDLAEEPVGKVGCEHQKIGALGDPPRGSPPDESYSLWLEEKREDCRLPGVIPKLVLAYQCMVASQLVESDCGEPLDEVVSPWPL